MFFIRVIRHPWCRVRLQNEGMKSPNQISGANASLRPGLTGKSQVILGPRLGVAQLSRREQHYPMSATPSPKSMAQRAWIAARFVLFGFVGFWVMLFFTVAFAVRVFEHDKQFISPFLSVPLALSGALMMLYGVGEWGHWAYLWVFLSIPFSLCLLMLVPGAGNSKGLPEIVAAVAAVLTYSGVRVYYTRGGRKESHENDRAT